MSSIFPILDKTAIQIKNSFKRFTPVDEGHTFPWVNLVYKGEFFRRAHLDIIDMRDTKGLYMMHLCIFPHTNDPAPIFGFDLIAGAKKVTGAFHDFSPVAADHALLDLFTRRVTGLNLTKPRDLPEWARLIFSEHIVAAGNITEPSEVIQICDLTLDNLQYYLDWVGEETAASYAHKHNQYCLGQRQNPHTPKVLKALGWDDELVERFITTCLFPYVEEQ